MIEKMTLTGVVFEFVITWLTFPVPLVCAKVIPGGTNGTDHANTVFDTGELNDIVAASPEQMVRAGGFAETEGIGFTTTEKINGFAGEHPFAVGVIAKFTLTGDVVEFEITCWILPVPDVCPRVMPGGTTGTVQVNVVPGTVEAKDTLTSSPEQMEREEGFGMTSGIGLMVIT